MLQYQILWEGRTPVLLFPMEHVESVSIGLWFRVGSRIEPAKAHGAAHFLEHMLFKGTRGRSARQISASVESVGGDLNAFTTEEMTCYFARVDGDHLGLVCEVLFDMVQDSVFATQEFERERGVIQEELRMYDDQPQIVVQELLQGMMWRGSSLSRPIAGTLLSISRMKRADVMEFWRQHYHPGSMIISLAGDFDVPHVVNLVRQLNRRPSTSRRAARWTPIRMEPRRQMIVGTRTRPVQQINLALGSTTFGRSDPRRFALKVLSVILGENSSSRLFQSIRERHGLAYSVNTSISQFQETGALTIQVGLESAQTLAALKLISRELSRVVEKPISGAELRRGKDYAIGQLKLGLESTTNQMMWMGECMLGHGRIFHPKEVTEGLQQVDARAVQQLAAELFQPGRMTLAWVGPEQGAIGEKELEQCCRLT
jgi:predicted Zn-dependent peptidase